MVARLPKQGESAGDLFPHLIAEYHPTKNNRESLFEYTSASGEKIFWVCSKCSLEWEAILSNRTRLGVGCPDCGKLKRAETQRGVTKKPKEGKSLAEKMPEVAKYFDEVKNGKTVYDIGTGSEYTYWWLCDRGHSIEGKIRSKISGYQDYGYFPCLTCYKEDKKKPSHERSLGYRFPEIAKTWHPTKNGDLTAFDVYANANTYVWWLCNEGHDTYALVNSKSNGHPCGLCRSYNASHIEHNFRLALSNVLDDVADTQVKLDIKFRSRKTMEVDVLGFFEGAPVVVEYDGQHFHKNDDVRERDFDKTLALLEAGYKVVRVRERKLFHLDIVDDGLFQVSHNFRRSFPTENVDDTVGMIMLWLKGTNVYTSMS